MAKFLGGKETASIEKDFKAPQDRYADFIDENYEFQEGYQSSNWRDPNQVRSIAEMVACLENDESVDIDARVLAYNKVNRTFGLKQIGKKEFLESFKNGAENWSGVNLREAGYDSFATDIGDQTTSGFVGQDFVPLLGGPFYKNLYFYDFIRQANAAFYAYHHDPIAHQAVNIIKDFTLGRGFRVDSDNKAALSIWRAFEKANRLQAQMDQLATELSVNGEVMIWKLPHDETKIVQVPYPNQPVPKGLIPRVRLLDATVFWEVVTVPEDITNVLYYVWVAPTQWQMYTGLDQNSMVPSSKFIFQTIPADQINHYKVNAFSNEKRGRSDLFSVLGFLKRLRDSVNYSLVALQKQASWCIDTTIEGSQADINAYIQDQASIGTIAPAGSEFVHTAKVKREYKGVEGTGKGGGNVTFEWALSCVASGMGIPISYFGTHLSGGQTRASAIVATEPVAKRFEGRQKIYEQVILDLWDHLMEHFGIDAQCEVTFPEIVTADRSQKLQDLAFAENMKWFSNERVANIVAKEFNVTDYIYEEEQDKIKEDPAAPAMASPLTAPPSTGSVPSVPKTNSSIPSEEKNQIKDQEYD
jgi:hypothetical protein